MFVLLSALVLVLLACGPARPVSQPTPTSAPAVDPGPAAPRSDFDKLVSEAAKEGSLMIIGTSLGPTKQAMSQVFRSKYGINIGYIDGRGPEVAAKVLAERRAGIYTADLGHTGDSTFLVEIKPNKITVPLEPFLFLPEVTDGSKWRGGQLPFIDEDRHAMSFSAMSVPPIIINTDFVKESEMTRNADLLNPRWKGRIVAGDPSIGGTANNWFTHVVTQLHKDREQGLKFMRDFARQEPVITRDVRMVAEWVARGKYPVGIGHSIPVTAEFQQAGAPIAFAGLGERSFLSPGSGNVYVFDKAPHPNAAKLYVNWLLSKEGAEIWTPAFGLPSLRMDLDAINSKFNPAFIPPKDAVLKREAYVALQNDMRAVATEIFKGQMK